jgi:hypothetical protein
MTTGMYRPDTRYERLYDEKEYFMNDRMYPGEFGMVVLLAIASLLVWSIAIFGITNEPKPDYNNATNGTSAY